VSTYVPFINGGARNIVDWLESMLANEGHHVEKIYLPEVDDPRTILRQIAAFRWIDLKAAELVICFRPESHVIQHPNKVLWFIHHIRSFYDLWDSPYRGFPADSTHLAIRSALHSADTFALREARAVFTNSQVVSDRLMHFNGVSSEVLYPPVMDPERFRCDGYGDEIVYICRIEHHKRQHLLVEAMAFTKTGVRLRIAGAGSDSSYIEGLRESARILGVEDRVSFDTHWITEGEKQDLLASCLAAAYVPLDEDSYGYPSLEASHAAKPIVTTSDSGGVLELVKDGVNGFVVPPTPEALAVAFDALHRERGLAKTMGESARSRVSEMNISWPHVIGRLLA
jgi:glycosyltransferase involved in cell wall biosynthesis